MGKTSLSYARRYAIEHQKFEALWLEQMIEKRRLSCRRFRLMIMNRQVDLFDADAMTSSGEALFTLEGGKA